MPRLRLFTIFVSFLFYLYSIACQDDFEDGETTDANTPRVSLSRPTSSSSNAPSRSPLLMLSTMDGTVSAFDAQTGDVLFTYRDSRPAVHSWAAPGHPEYVPSLDGLLYRIDRETEEAHVVEGKFITRDHASNLANALPLTSRDASDAVVLTSEDSSLLFVDVRAGRVIRETRFADASPPDPPLTSRSDVIVLVQRTAVSVRIIDTSNGRELANATLVHTEPRFWQHGRCLAAPNPSLDQFVAYTTDSRDRIVVRNLRTGAVLWTKDVSAPVVEAHGLGGVRIASSHQEAIAATEAKWSNQLPVRSTYTGQSQFSREVVVTDDGRYIYAIPVGAHSDRNSVDEASIYNVPVPVRKNLHRFKVANVRDPTTLGAADRVLGIARLPRRMHETDVGQNPDDFTVQAFSIEVGISFLILLLVGVAGYIIGRRPRRVEKTGSIRKRRHRLNPDIDSKIQLEGQASRPNDTNLHDLDDSDTDTTDHFFLGSGRNLNFSLGISNPSLSFNEAALESSNGSTGSASAGPNLGPSKSAWVTVGRLHVSPTVLGYGSHGTVVYEGKLMPEERKVAVKRLLRQFYESAKQEISLLVQLDEASPHVVRYFAMEEAPEFIYLALELCASSLAECISNRTPPVPSEQFSCGPPPQFTSRALRQLMQGLADLHRVGVVHRDVKPQNVLITRSTNGVGDVKLADVGLALRLGENRSSYTALSNAGGGIGTTGWRAPEVLSGGRQTKAVDVFSAGCIISSVLTGGDHPYGNAVFSRDGNIAAGIPTLTSLESLGLPEAIDIVRKMIDPLASRRPTAEQVLLHPFFWTDATKLSFLVDISDRLYDLRHNAVRYTENLDWYPMARKYCSDWLVLMDMNLLRSLGREYENTASGLLRVIRNKRNHYSELPASIRSLLGPLPEDRPGTSADSGLEMESEASGNFLTYFTKKVPNLFMCIYRYALENPALIDQPHFTRYGIKQTDITEKISFQSKAEFLNRSSETENNTNSIINQLHDVSEQANRPKVFVDDDVNESKIARKEYHRHKLVALQVQCETVGFEVQRRLIIAGVFEPKAFKRLKKRLATNDFSCSDFADEDPISTSFNQSEASSGYTRATPRTGYTSSIFGTRIQNGFAPTAEPFAPRPSVPASDITSQTGIASRRNGDSGIMPTVSQFSGEERVVDFGALRRRKN